MDDRGAAPGLEVLKKIGGWPVLGNWDPTNWSIEDTLIRSIRLGLEGENLIDYSLGADLADNKKINLRVVPPGLPILREYLIEGKKNSVVKMYFDYMVDMAVMYGADKRTAEEAMEKVLDFQIELARVMPQNVERGDIKKMLKQITLRELDEDPNKLLDWRKLFKGLVSPIELQDDQRIDFFNLEVMRKVLTLVNEYSADVVANHVMWEFAIKMSPYLTIAIRNQGERLHQMLRGTFGRRPRWRECMDEFDGIGLAKSAIYVNKFFDKSSRNKVKAISDQIRKEMDLTLREADWMDEETRKKALRKSANMLHMIGYPDELADMAKVEEFYKELNLKEDHFFEAQMDLTLFHIKSELNKINKPFNKRSWQTFSKMTYLSPYYIPTENAMVATAAILQEPIFSASVPSYLNYARIGFYIGHEVTHAFDDLGRQFDDEADLKDWWDETTSNQFNEKKQCFIDQYSSFIESVTKRKVNGVRTQGENIADNGGLKLAYRAYRQLVKKLKKPEPGLPGLKQYNNDQLFFIHFANDWCSSKSFESTEFDLLTDKHSPPEWRVNGMVMNMPEFGELFGCEKGTPMNPKEKCKVW